MPEMKNRKGKVRLIFELLYDRPETALLVFSKFIPFYIVPEISTSLSYDCATYIGISPLFNELKEGEAIPEYDAVITTKDGSEQLEFKRV